MPFTPGATVGPYRLISQLGQGGMATVFKAYHAALDRDVALKVLHPAFKEDPGFLVRFQREARVVAKLEHPAIVPVHDFSEHDGQPYLVMRFVEGETLKARLARGRLSIQEVSRIVAAVGDALSFAHRQGVLHRDIKPSNILLGADGGVYLSDFGLARIAQAGESTVSRDMLMGTPQYISPEQARGDATLDERTDVYSFGVVLYELMAGRVPFSGDTPYSIIHDHIYTPLPLPRTINPQVSEAVERVLLKALAKDRQDRYPSIEAMVSAFQQAIEVGPPPPAAAKPPAHPASEEAAQVPAEPSSPGRVAQAVERVEAQHARYRTCALIALVAACLCLAALGPVALRRFRLWRQESRTPAVATPVPPSPSGKLPSRILAFVTPTETLKGTGLPQEAGISGTLADHSWLEDRWSRRGLAQGILSAFNP
jgi:serine/threonine protein kinase